VAVAAAAAQTGAFPVLPCLWSATDLRNKVFQEIFLALFFVKTNDF